MWQDPLIGGESAFAVFQGAHWQVPGSDPEELEPYQALRYAMLSLCVYMGILNLKHF